MQRMTWMMLLILSLPVQHPARPAAVEELAERMAALQQSAAKDRRRN